jgi:hypothetical protein
MGTDILQIKGDYAVMTFQTNKFSWNLCSHYLQSEICWDRNPRKWRTVMYLWVHLTTLYCCVTLCDAADSCSKLCLWVMIFRKLRQWRSSRVLCVLTEFVYAEGIASSVPNWNQTHPEYQFGAFCNPVPCLSSLNNIAAFPWRTRQTISVTPREASTNVVVLVFATRMATSRPVHDSFAVVLIHKSRLYTENCRKYLGQGECHDEVTLTPDVSRISHEVQYESVLSSEYTRWTVNANPNSTI